MARRWILAAHALLILALPASAADTGWLDPTSCSNVEIGFTDWTSPTNADTEDGAVSLVNVGLSDVLLCNYSATVPAGATGITIDFRYKRREGGTSAGTINTNRFTADGITDACDLAGDVCDYEFPGTEDWESSLTFKTHTWSDCPGSPTQPSVAQAASFCGALGVVGPGAAEDAEVDVMQARVVYTPAVVPTATPTPAGPTTLLTSTSGETTTGETDQKLRGRRGTKTVLARITGTADVDVMCYPTADTNSEAVKVGSTLSATGITTFDEWCEFVTLDVTSCTSCNVLGWLQSEGDDL